MTVPPFFRIPRELRDRIYHLALLNQCAKVYTANVSLNIHYIEESDFVGQYETQNLRWLLTSRQILLEGLDQFYDHATLRDHSICTYGGTNSLTLDGKTSIFDLGRVKVAELFLQMGKAHHEWDGKYYDLIVPRGKEISELTDENFAYLGKAIESMDHCSLEELNLTVCLFRTYNETKKFEDTGNRWVVNLNAGNEAEDDEEDHDDSDSDSDGGSDTYTEGYWNQYGTNLTGPDWTHGYLVDFDFLKSLGTKWKRIRIEYIPTYMLSYWGDEDPVAANIVAVPIIQEGLAEIAKELVGGQGWVIRDSVLPVQDAATRWVLHVERASGDEKTQELKHIGLRDYLAECEGCGETEETFTLQGHGENDVILFKGTKCGHVVEIETPVVGREM